MSIAKIMDAHSIQFEKLTPSTMDKLNTMQDKVSAVNRLIDLETATDAPEMEKAVQEVKDATDALNRAIITDGVNKLTAIDPKEVDKAVIPATIISRWLSARFVKQYKMVSGKKKDAPAKVIGSAESAEISLEKLCKACLLHLPAPLTPDPAWREKMEVFHHNLMVYAINADNDEKGETITAPAPAVSVSLNAKRFGYPWCDTEDGRKATSRTALKLQLSAMFNAIIPDNLRTAEGGKVSGRSADLNYLAHEAWEDNAKNRAYAEAKATDFEHFETCFVKYLVLRWEGLSFVVHDADEEDPAPISAPAESAVKVKKDTPAPAEKESKSKSKSKTPAPAEKK